MKRPPLEEWELELIRGVFARHPKVTSAILFGSRAKGTHTRASDVDLAVTGEVTPLEAEALAGDLDELSLPYRFEVQPLGTIAHPPLREHIARVGVCLYRPSQAATVGRP